MQAIKCNYIHRSTIIIPLSLLKSVCVLLVCFKRSSNSSLYLQNSPGIWYTLIICSTVQYSSQYTYPLVIQVCMCLCVSAWMYMNARVCECATDLGTLCTGVMRREERRSPQHSGRDSVDRTKLEKSDSCFKWFCIGTYMHTI